MTSPTKKVTDMTKEERLIDALHRMATAKGWKAQQLKDTARQAYNLAVRIYGVNHGE